RAVLDLVVGGHGLDLASGEFRPALLAEIAERQQRQAMTGLADLAIDPEAALHLAAVELTERPGERPFLARWLRLAVRLLGGRLRRRSEHERAADHSGPEHRGHLALEPRFRDRVRQRLRRLEEAEQRQHDQQVDEVPRGEDARGYPVAALRRLRAEPAEADADDDEDPEELPVQRPI